MKKVTLESKYKVLDYILDYKQWLSYLDPFSMTTSSAKGSCVKSFIFEFIQIHS